MLVVVFLFLSDFLFAVAFLPAFLTWCFKPQVFRAETTPGWERSAFFAFQSIEQAAALQTWAATVKVETLKEISGKYLNGHLGFYCMFFCVCVFFLVCVCFCFFLFLFFCHLFCLNVFCDGGFWGYLKGHLESFGLLGFCLRVCVFLFLWLVISRVT